MKLREWEAIPAFMQCSEVRAYYDILLKKKRALRLKRLFDIALSGFMLIILIVPMVIIAIMIKRDSKGPIFYRQIRVTSYGNTYRIHKFRTMILDADQIGSAVTIDGDERITRIGGKLRNLRLDELPQLLDVLTGRMSFVGTRPEVPKYVEHYTNEMKATLLLPAGITSETSIRYKDEAILLNSAEDVDRLYLETVLPDKMRYNLESLKSFSLGRDFITMLRMVLAVLGKEYN